MNKLISGNHVKGNLKGENKPYLLFDYSGNYKGIVFTKKNNIQVFISGENCFFETTYCIADIMAKNIKKEFVRFLKLGVEIRKEKLLKIREKVVSETPSQDSVSVSSPGKRKTLALPGIGEDINE